jgi:hypothetical protein
MTTCECPNPPGGSVSCAPTQFAYCRRVGAALVSGCITVDIDKHRPAPGKVQSALERALRAAGLDDWTNERSVRFVNESYDIISPISGLEIEQTLYRAMIAHHVVVLVIEAEYRAGWLDGPLLYVRFPAIWADFPAAFTP